MQTEAADGMSFSEPLRRYANSVALDLKLAHRGTLANGELKAGAPVNTTPQVQIQCLFGFAPSAIYNLKRQIIPIFGSAS